MYVRPATTKAAAPIAAIMALGMKYLTLVRNQHQLVMNLEQDLTVMIIQAVNGNHILLIVEV